jgi:transcriptional regulator with XRE-family HTH domain
MAIRLKRLREQAGLSQAALARLAGVPLATLREWEHGRRTPLLDRAVLVARALGVTLNELAGEPEPERRRRPSDN